jgi:hypothetical protein
MAETDPMNINERRKYLHKVRLRRVYDDARTPFDRLCYLQAIASDKQAELQALHQATNPLTPHREIQTLIDRLSALPCAPQEVNEDVRLTLHEKALPLA